MQTLKELFGFSAVIMEAIGVFTILAGFALATIWMFAQLRAADKSAVYGEYRRKLGKAIILGLEFLIAGDIIRTVAVSHTFESVAVLGVIVLIRTFLSITLEYGIEGHWPWRPATRRRK